MSNNLMRIFITCLILAGLSISSSQPGLWSSAEELSRKPMEGAPWLAVKAAADAADPYGASVSNQNSDNSAEILAAGIVYARTGTESYKIKVITACERLANAGKPGDRTLAWAREAGAYALAADLAGYRTAGFEAWCRNTAEIWKATDDRTLLSMFRERPNNWGTQAFGTLCALYGFLRDTVRLNEVREYWIRCVVGPKPAELSYGSDLTWHADPDNPRLINPKGSMKQGLLIDGVLPDDMRRGLESGNSFRIPPLYTNYVWGAQQGIIMGARILARLDKSIWTVADSAIYRVGYCYQVRYAGLFGPEWKAQGDDAWMLPFYDDAYGTQWSQNQEQLWEHGKNTGWPFVVWKGNAGFNSSYSNPLGRKCGLLQNYPNPFNFNTVVNCSLPQPSDLDVAVYDIFGRKVKVLMEGRHSAGTYRLPWNARDSDGMPVQSGIYFCRLRSERRHETRRMLFIR